jgi:hypothetical protein
MLNQFRRHQPTVFAMQLFTDWFDAFLFSILDEFSIDIPGACAHSPRKPGSFQTTKGFMYAG